MRLSGSVKPQAFTQPSREDSTDGMSDSLTGQFRVLSSGLGATADCSSSTARTAAGSDPPAVFSETKGTAALSVIAIEGIIAVFFGFVKRNEKDFRGVRREEFAEWGCLSASGGVLCGIIGFFIWERFAGMKGTRKVQPEIGPIPARSI